jgi:hypothetical protein
MGKTESRQPDRATDTGSESCASPRAVRRERLPEHRDRRIARRVGIESCLLPLPQQAGDSEHDHRAFHREAIDLRELRVRVAAGTDRRPRRRSTLWRGTRGSSGSWCTGPCTPRRRLASPAPLGREPRRARVPGRHRSPPQRGGDRPHLCGDVLSRLLPAVLFPSLPTVGAPTTVSRGSRLTRSSATPGRASSWSTLSRV